VPDLKAIYLDALRDCAPETVLRGHSTNGLPRNVIAIGKCAGPLFDGLASVAPIEQALVIVPLGYPAPARDSKSMRVLYGGHPQITSSSFDAGRVLLEFAGSIGEALVLISGGASACVDAALAPWLTSEDLASVNARLLDVGFPIAQMNVVRRHLSAIKGGRLAARIGGRVVTMIFSDVATGQLHDVGSGPTLADGSTTADAIDLMHRIGGCEPQIERMSAHDFPDTPKSLDNIESQLLADNSTFVAAAARHAAARGWNVRRLDAQLECDVQTAAELLIEEAARLDRGMLLAAGGEVTIRVAAAGGRGGRCSELAARFTLAARQRGLGDVSALFGSSDGVDGSSPAAAIVMQRVSDRPPSDHLLDAIRRSDTFSASEELGETVMIQPTGNNLRDLVLLARA